MSCYWHLATWIGWTYSEVFLSQQWTDFYTVDKLLCHWPLAHIDRTHGKALASLRWTELMALMSVMSLASHHTIRLMGRCFCCFGGLNGWHVLVACGQRRKCLMDNIKEWTSLPMPELLTRASCRKDWKRISADSPVVLPPVTQSVKGLK